MIKAINSVSVSSFRFVNTLWGIFMWEFGIDLMYDFNKILLELLICCLTTFVKYFKQLSERVVVSGITLLLDMGKSVCLVPFYGQTA